MACCLTAPSHYLNQCWQMIREVLWYSPESNLTKNTQDIYRWNEFEIYWLESVVKSRRGQWVNTCLDHFRYNVRYHGSKRQWWKANRTKKMEWEIYSYWPGYSIYNELSYSVYHRWSLGAKWHYQSQMIRLMYVTFIWSYEEDMIFSSSYSNNFVRCKSHRCLKLYLKY